MNSWMKRYVGRGPEVSWAQKLPFLWGAQPPCTWVRSLTRKISELCCLGILREASSSRHDGLLTQSLRPLPSPEIREYGLKVHALAFPGTRLYSELGAPSSHLSHYTKDILIAMGIPRV